MKQVYLIIFLSIGMLFTNTPASVAQSKADDIIGDWLNADKDRKIQFTKAGNGTYYAKISWLKKANDEEYKMDMVVINGLTFKNGEYRGGQAYSPSNGGWVKATAKLKDINTLNVTGYKYFLSKTRSYTRAK